MCKRSAMARTAAQRAASASSCAGVKIRLRPSTRPITLRGPRASTASAASRDDGRSPSSATTARDAPCARALSRTASTSACHSHSLGTELGQFVHLPGHRASRRAESPGPAGSPQNTAPGPPRDRSRRAKTNRRYTPTRRKPTGAMQANHTLRLDAIFAVGAAADGGNGGSLAVGHVKRV